MCAILGIVPLPGCTLSSEEACEIFGELLISGMSRGTDATGFAFKGDSNMIYSYKAPLPAYSFVSKYLNRYWPKELPNVVIGHTRAATNGKPHICKNNHPVFDQRGGVCVVHNGTIRNFDHLFSMNDIPKETEVDSEIIPKLIAEYYWDGGADTKGNMDASIKAASEDFVGGFAYMVLSSYVPDTLWIVRNKERPVSLCYLPEKRVLLVASLTSYFNQVLGVSEYICKYFEHKLPGEELLIRTIADNSIIKINYQAEDDKIFQISSFTPQPAYQTQGYQSCVEYYNGYNSAYDCMDDVEDYTPVQTRKVEKPKQLQLPVSMAECPHRRDGICTANSTVMPFPCYMLETPWNGRFIADMCPREE